MLQCIAIFQAEEARLRPVWRRADQGFEWARLSCRREAAHDGAGRPGSCCSRSGTRDAAQRFGCLPACPARCSPDHRFYPSNPDADDSSPLNHNHAQRKPTTNLARNSAISAPRQLVTCHTDAAHIASTTHRIGAERSFWYAQERCSLQRSPPIARP